MLGYETLCMANFSEPQTNLDQQVTRSVPQTFHYRLNEFSGKLLSSTVSSATTCVHVSTFFTTPLLMNW